MSKRYETEKETDSDNEYERDDKKSRKRERNRKRRNYCSENSEEETAGRRHRQSTELNGKLQKEMEQPTKSCRVYWTSKSSNPNIYFNTLIKYLFF